MYSPRLYASLCASFICAANLPAHAEDNPAQAAARVALIQKMQELNSLPPWVYSIPIPADNPEQAAARTALMQKLQDLGELSPGWKPAPGPTTTPAAAPVAPLALATVASNAAPTSVSAPTAPATPAPVIVEKPITGPESPLTADQQARLQTLDAKYRANQISPLDYFTQREAILKGQ